MVAAVKQDKTIVVRPRPEIGVERTLKALPKRLQNEGESVKSQILDLLSSWGKNTIFRFLRDHHLLEAFIAKLPLQNFEDSGEFVLQKNLIGMWDDFTLDKLNAIKTWQRSNFDASLGKKVIAFALDLDRRGAHKESLAALRIASDLDRMESMETIEKDVAALEPSDVVVATEAGVGFGSDRASGVVTKVTMLADASRLIAVTAGDNSFSFTAALGEKVIVQHMVKNRVARSLKAQALDRLIRAQVLAPASVQPRLARLRYTLQQEIEDMS